LPPHPSVVFICPWLDAVHAEAIIVSDIFLNFFVVRTIFFGSAFTQQGDCAFHRSFLIYCILKRGKTTPHSWLAKTVPEQ